jgi:hypothetical protein
MATTFSTGSSAAVNAKRGLGLQARYASYEFSAALVVNDVFQMVPVYSGESVLGVELFVDSLDTSTGVVLDVGDDGDVDRYIDGSIIGRSSAGGAQKGNVGSAQGHVYTADNTLDVLIQAAPTTSTTAGTITLVAYVVGD